MRRANFGSNLILGFFLFCAVVVIIQLYGLPYFPKAVNPPVPGFDANALETKKLAEKLDNDLKQLKSMISDVQDAQRGEKTDEAKMNEQIRELLKTVEQQSKQLSQLQESLKQQALAPSPSKDEKSQALVSQDGGEMDEYLASRLKRAPADKHDLIKRLHTLLNPKRECNKGGWQEKYTQLHKDILAGKAKKRFATYRCSGGICGGFGDRMVGVTDVMMLSVMDDRAFLIDWTSPFDVTQYLTSHLDWKYNEDKVKSLSNSNIYAIDQPPRQHTEWAKSDMAEYIKTDSVVIQANQHFFHCFLFNDHYKAKLDQMGLNQATAQGCLLNYLYKPTTELATYIKEFKEKHFSPVLTIGMQIRTGGEGRLGSDPVRIPYAQTNHWYDCAKKIAEHLGVDDKDVKWFLSTDSETVRNFATSTYGDKVITTNGTITHIELSPRDLVNSGSNDLKIILDHRLLMESDLIIGSPSNFARTASTMSNKFTYMYWPDFLINTCDLSLIQGKEIDWNMKTHHCPPQ